jgi:hypothetical protein
MIPKKVKDNVMMAIAANYMKGNKCATMVGKTRANQILKGDLSIETLKRTYNYLKRAKTYDQKDWSKCGTISYNLWGGDEMLKYCKNKLNKK